MGVLETWISRREGGLSNIADEELNTVNMLFECLIITKKYSRGVEHVLELEASNPDLVLPLDLAVKKGICLIGCGRHEESQVWSLFLASSRSGCEPGGG